MVASVTMSHDIISSRSPIHPLENYTVMKQDGVDGHLPFSVSRNEAHQRICNQLNGDRSTGSPRSIHFATRTTALYAHSLIHAAYTNSKFQNTGK